MNYRLAYSLEDLRNEINRRWPNRSKVSDGWIGDAAHQSRASDHNPWRKGSDGRPVVGAIDVTASGIDPQWLINHLFRQAATIRDRRLLNGGYLIFNRRITNANWSGWRTYTGANPHTSHVHISCSTDRFDDRNIWGVAGGGTTPAPRPAPAAGGGGGSDRMLKFGSRGQAVRNLQARLNRDYPLYSKLAVDGIYGKGTENTVREFQRRAGLAADGIAGPKTLSALHL